VGKGDWEGGTLRWTVDADDGARRVDRAFHVELGLGRTFRAFPVELGAEVTPSMESRG
jgi:hypothetical protein